MEHTKTAKKKVKAPAPKPAKVRTIDQLSIARIIAQKFELKLSDVVSIIEEEQKLTMEYARMGYKVIKKNYLSQSYGFHSHLGRILHVYGYRSFLVA